MLSTIFAPEITTLESEVAALQEQLAATQERISQFSEIQSMTTGWLQTGLTLKEKVSALAADAITKLKQTVLQNLFGGNDTPDGDDGGNQCDSLVVESR